MADPISIEAFATLKSRNDLQRYGNRSLILYALELSLHLEDIHSVAATSLTDGPDDKKCDLVYIDREIGKAIIGQSFEASSQTKTSAPANKASDLNTAAAWLLASSPSDSLPPTLASARTELVEALQEGSITQLEFWYCHNLPESDNVQRELQQVERAARSLLNANFQGHKVESVVAREVGRTTIADWYRASQAPILVNRQYELTVDGGFLEKGDTWEAYCTSVSAAWLRSLYEEEHNDLFSANVRDYLGSRRSAKNINNNIQETARSQPERFWVYNNGVTALVNEFHIDEAQKRLVISGISIVNGAQTTGALGSVSADANASLGQARVLARFVKCTDADVIYDIIRYNNSQNVIQPSDFRSNDPIQQRLRNEFKEIPQANYYGGRRGSERDRVKRPANLLPSDTVAQALAAFHQEPHVAYNERTRIWSDDATYSRFFSERTTARHIVFAYSLVRAIEDAKVTLISMKNDKVLLTEAQEEQLAFLRQRGSIYLLTAAMAACIEVYISRPVPNKWSLRFAKNVSPDEGKKIWTQPVETALSLAKHLEEALTDGLKKREKVVDEINKYRRLVDATKLANKTVYDDFAREVKYQ